MQPYMLMMLPEELEQKVEVCGDDLINSIPMFRVGESFLSFW